MIYSGTKSGLDDLADIVKQAVDDLRPHKQEWDSIAVTGCSGMLVGSPVSLALNVPLVVVRKEYDRIHSHCSGLIINSSNIGTRYCFLDDFIGTGDTRDRVKKTIEVEAGVCLPRIMTAIYQYQKNSASGGVYKSLPIEARARDNLGRFTKRSCV